MSIVVPNRRIFVFWRSFWIQNGRHMLQHVLLPVNIHFHWNLFIFEFLTIFLIFILATILKILKTEHNFEWWSIFVSSFKRICCLEWIKKKLHLGYHGNGYHFEFFSTPQKLPHTMVDIPTKFDEVWWKESNIFFNPPFFVSMATVAKFVQQILIFLDYLVSLDVDVVPIKFHQFL
jgi:hypothetical protein